LTVLYILNTFVILGVFVLVLGYFGQRSLQTDLVGEIGPNIDAQAVIQNVYNDLRASTAVLICFVLLAMAILSYFLIRTALRPLKAFVDGQRRFISDASHELRTPLATVKTENEVALLDPEHLNREEALSLLRSNVEEIDRISTILNNLLNLASFNNATGTPPFSAVNISLVAARVLDRMKMSAELKQIRVTRPSDMPSILVWGNATALEEIIANLLKNALQYTPAGGEVRLNIQARAKDKKAEVVVRDTGIGIAPKDLPYVFEPFYRSDKSLHMHQQGNGLGLPLVREIVKRHKGSIHIQSAPDKGTMVSILIPLAPRA